MTKRRRLPSPPNLSFDIAWLRVPEHGVHIVALEKLYFDPL